jgi:hypothetical protein
MYSIRKIRRTKNNAMYEYDAGYLVIGRFDG